MSETDLSEFDGVWHTFFFSGGTKPNKEAFAGRACVYLQALSSSAIPRHIYQKSQFKSWSCFTPGEVHRSLLPGLSSLSLVRGKQ